MSVGSQGVCVRACVCALAGGWFVCVCFSAGHAL